MNPYKYFIVLNAMKTKADKFDLRLNMVRYAIDNGVKPAAREFAATPKTVRKWLHRYRQERLTGLNELPRIPLSCPHKTSAVMERRIVALRKRYPFMGAKRLKYEHDLVCSHSAIGRIIKEHALVRRSRKKHKRKKDLREVKRHWMLFGQISVDTKELKDIPHYWPQMKNLDLPKYQFTAREVRSGNMYLGYAKEKNAANACLFVRKICEHLEKCGVDMSKLNIQTDNGSEFIGCRRQNGSRDGFETVVNAFGSKHKRIPVRAWSYNSDVETVHSTIECEFFDIENFEGPEDFHLRVASYQAWYNLVRINSHKDNKSPWQIINDSEPKLNIDIAKLTPIMLDWLEPDRIRRDKLSLRGYHVPCST